MTLIIVPKEKTNVLTTVAIDGDGNLLVDGEAIGHKIIQIADSEETESMLDDVFG